MLEDGDAEMEDLFESHEDRQDDDDDPRGDDVDGENEPAQDGGEADSQAAAKPKRKVIRNPQPKLDHERLIGKRGIPILAKVFEDVKFKGRGHEREDLKKVLHVMEHWAHRLFPPMPFDAVLSRVETLGKKRQVKTMLQRIRMDMPILDEDFITNPEEEARPGSAASQRNDEEARPGSAASQRNGGDVFDQLLADREGESQPPRAPSPVIGSVRLTNQQRERMEANRRLAAERLAARNLAMQAAENSHESSSQPLNYRSQESSSQPLANNLATQPANYSQESTSQPVNNSQNSRSQSAGVKQSSRVESTDEEMEVEPELQKGNTMNSSPVHETSSRNDVMDSDGDDPDVGCDISKIRRHRNHYLDSSSDDDDTKLVMNI